jgi:hypothetical protein
MVLKIIIDRFEGEKAVLKTENNENIIWPKNQLPKNSKEGESLLFIITNSKEEGESSKQLAKNIINEILNTDND